LPPGDLSQGRKDKEHFFGGCLVVAGAVAGVIGGGIVVAACPAVGGQRTIGDVHAVLVGIGFLLVALACLSIGRVNAKLVPKEPEKKGD